MHELFWTLNSAEQRIWGSALPLHRGPCVSVMSDAIRYSSSLLNSPGTYYRGPRHFPFQVAIDCIFKSVFNDHSTSGFNSAAFLCPRKTGCEEWGKQQKIKNNFVAYQEVRGYVALQPPVWLHIPVPPTWIWGKTDTSFLMIATGDSLHDAKHAMCLSWSQSQHPLNSSCFLKKSWACYNLQKFTGWLSTCWHTVCIFSIQTKLQCVPLKNDFKELLSICKPRYI